MSSKNSRDGSNEQEASWGNETLPLSLRKELLERELRKLGIRKAGADAHGGSAHQQQHSHGTGGHPQADGDSGSHSE